ncbi:MAG TPA: zf-TFIIB domain-containing protein [Spirochaetota bacterium]|nr:zf-TFIIB domain-containing protein [Spirochaetota bacterium]
MICPRCKKTLVIEVKDGEKIDVCRSCGGMWLHRHQLNNLLKESGGDVESCSIDDNPHADPNPVILCRECENTKMKKVNFLDYSDIIMDYCPSCGAFWLDRDELSKMRSYIQKIEDGSHTVTNFSGYSLLTKLSEIAYSIFR